MSMWSSLTNRAAQLRAAAGNLLQQVDAALDEGNVFSDAPSVEKKPEDAKGASELEVSYISGVSSG